MQYLKDRLARKNGELPPLVFKKARKPIPKKKQKTFRGENRWRNRTCKLV